MIERFRGVEGRARLVEALLQQEAVANERPVAERLALTGELVEFRPGAAIIEQGAADDDVYFLIHGNVAVVVNGHVVAQRNGGQSVGELAAIDAAAPRSATVRATNTVTALRVSRSAFLEAGDESAAFWKRLATQCAKRLREREKFHLPPNPTPVMFIGSARESLDVAEATASALAGSSIDVRLWSKGGVFGPSSITIESLMEQVEVADFALLVLGPDDKIQSREVERFGPRDNVIFEMGLFLGRLGRRRVFMMQDDALNLKIPSDLAGVHPIKFKRDAGSSLNDCLCSPCEEIRKIVTERGPLPNRMRI